MSRDTKILNDLKSRLKIDYDSLKADQPCLQWIFNYDIDDIDDPIHEAEKMAIENVKEYLKSLIDDIEMESNSA